MNYLGYIRMRGSLCLNVAAALFGLFASSYSIAEPTIRSFSGTVSAGSQLSVSGSGFGYKSPAKPYLWAPMDGTAQPSGLGIVNSWTRVDQMTYRNGCGPAGGGCFEGSASNGVATNNWVAAIAAPPTMDWNAYGKRTYVYRKSKRTFDYDSSKNVKILRAWGTSNGTDIRDPNFYFATSNGRLGVEGVPEPYSDYTMSSATLVKAKGQVGQWYTEEFEFGSNSSSNVADADFRLSVNGGAPLVSFPNTGWMVNSVKLKSDAGSANDGRMRILFPVHMVVEGSDGWVPSASGSRYWADDIYVDTTPARVMIGDASTFDSCTVREIQIPVSWTDQSLSVVANVEAFPAGKAMYLFVVDADGVPSKGFAIATPARPMPPTLKAD